MKECNAANGQNNHQYSNTESNKVEISSIKQIISLLCLTFRNIRIKANIFFSVSDKMHKKAQFQHIILWFLHLQWTMLKRHLNSPHSWNSVYLPMY